MKPRKIPLMELINFCEKYNSIGFGRAKIFELKSKFIVELYNGGYSENEYLDGRFKGKYKDNIILDRHPITISEFSKLDLLYNDCVVNFEGVAKDYDFCWEREEYKYTLEIR